MLAGIENMSRKNNTVCWYRKLITDTDIAMQ